MAEQTKVETTITHGPFRCVVRGYRVVTKGGIGYHELVSRSETDDPWKVMQLVDRMHTMTRQDLAAAMSGG